MGECSIFPSTFFTSLGLIEPAATLTIAVAESALGSGSSIRRRFETGPNSVNCRARIADCSSGSHWLFAAGLVEEPDSPLRLVDPDLDQARRRHVAVLVADDVGLAHPRGERLVVFAQFGEHVI